MNSIPEGANFNAIDDADVKYIKNVNTKNKK